jgi:hypothetical protein
MEITPSGRTRQFDVNEALDRALEVFWARGYEGATLPELIDCATLARYNATVLNGLAVQSASGATEKELRLVSALAMQVWPT